MSEKIKELEPTIQISSTSISNDEVQNTSLESQQNQDIESQQKNEQNSSSTDSMKNFYVIASGYLLFTLTDSGLRMIILFQLYNLKYNALQISSMFTLYEFFGVITNLFGGILGSRLGLKFCLLTGLVFQIIGIGLLCGLRLNWGKTIVIIYIIISQGFSGIAKDMVKLGGKSVTKLVTNDGQQSKLFKLVAWLTGAKNSVKGAGFFWGALLFKYIGYIPALLVLLVMNLIVIPPALFYLDHTLAGRDVNILSLARMFLFGSRDLWFEVPVPLFLRGPIGWSYLETGAFLAGWVIFYGAIQSSTPQLILKPARIYPVTSGKILVPFTIILFFATIGIAFGLQFINIKTQRIPLIILIIVGTFIFAFIFAINSSIHSFLILAYCHRDKVAMNVGFYYMGNSLGRLFGLIIGGILFTYLNLAACLWFSSGALILCTIISFYLGPIPEDISLKNQS
ncbi:organoarsenical effux MFS transporter ArsJ [Rhizophagus clarus]|uniref:Organoarsenical effux MFS transporter ArsJ n=1 Tax=Rhizophagus clarus TaxID=94130 RepID=A0A8H3L704_9GLOM|nr:organoarsenical effux MFS transporter ArsJ [Rhizophagus clarus]